MKGSRHTPLHVCGGVTMNVYDIRTVGLASVKVTSEQRLGGGDLVGTWGRESLFTGPKPRSPGFWHALFLRAILELRVIKISAWDTVMPLSDWSCPFGHPCRAQHGSALRARVA